MYSPARDVGIPFFLFSSLEMVSKHNRSGRTTQEQKELEVPVNGRF